MNWRTRITADPAICHGKACIKATRSMASVVLDNLAADQSPEDIVRLYRTLQLEDVTAVIAVRRRAGAGTDCLDRRVKFKLDEDLSPTLAAWFAAMRPRCSFRC
jgi:uncharacterized protein (DUF433 family)